ncbi:hypothetical protein [Alteromonas gracilis]|uniref:hypothetical protein n=1 Tax=Alteromonas gracilis TaxID=1479524 RepID=UPI0030CE286A
MAQNIYTRMPMYPCTVWVSLYHSEKRTMSPDHIKVTASVDNTLVHTGIYDYADNSDSDKLVVIGNELNKIHVINDTSDIPTMLVLNTFLDAPPIAGT